MIACRRVGVRNLFSVESTTRLRRLDVASVALGSLGDTTHVSDLAMSCSVESTTLLCDLGVTGGVL